MRNWHEFSDYMVSKCNEYGGYYKVKVNEASRLTKESKEGIAGGKSDRRIIRETVIPVFMTRHPDYEFGLSKDEEYIWCRRRGVLG